MNRRQPNLFGAFSPINVMLLLQMHLKSEALTIAYRGWLDDWEQSCIDNIQNFNYNANDVVEY